MRKIRSAKGDRPDAVALFLEGALGAGPVAVSELEAKARAAGLVGERQNLSDTKSFRAAKKRLAIRSVRTGFGRGGEWSWALAGQHSAAVALDRSPGARASVIYEEAHSRPKQREVVTPAPANFQRAPEEAPRKPTVPADWVRGVELLRRQARPSGVPQHRWQLFLEDCARFLDPFIGWAVRAAKLGWDAEALFGCDRHRPLDQPGAGLLWRVAGGRLTAIYKDWATIDAGDGAQRVFHRRPGTTNVTLPWLLR